MTDLFSTMRTINKIGKYLPALFLFLSIADVVFASTIYTSLSSVCETTRLVLAVGAMIMVVLAAITYAMGQIMGAETRARATVWATAMMTGALIGIAIYMLAPYIIKAIVGGGGTTGEENPCKFTLS